MKLENKGKYFKNLDYWIKNPWIGNYRISKLKNCGSRKFHGNFIPEIPYQMMLRYTNEKEWILDPMAGSGTTKDVAKLINRNCDMYDIEPIRKDIKKEDVLSAKYNKIYDMIILHPPYFNIIKFTDNINDLSNCLNLKDYLERMKLVINKLDSYLRKERYFILVLGNIYHKLEEHPLGFYISEYMRTIGYLRKAIIMKDYGKQTQENINKYSKTKNLWRYRLLKYGLWQIAGDFIYVMKKEK